MQTFWYTPITDKKIRSVEPSLLVFWVYKFCAASWASLPMGCLYVFCLTLYELVKYKRQEITDILMRCEWCEGFGTGDWHSATDVYCDAQASCRLQRTLWHFVERNQISSITDIIHSVACWPLRLSHRNLETFSANVLATESGLWWLTEKKPYISLDSHSILNLSLIVFFLFCHTRCV